MSPCMAFQLSLISQSAFCWVFRVPSIPRLSFRAMQSTSFACYELAKIAFICPIELLNESFL